MNHEVEILFDDRFLARPYTCKCSCGWIGSTVDVAEAEHCKESHLAYVEWDQNRQRITGQDA